MKRRDFLISTAAATGLAALGAPLAAADPPKRRILMFTKSSGFQHSVITRKAEELGHAERIAIEIGRQHGFEVVPTKDGRVFDSDLAPFDGFIFYTTGVLTEPPNAQHPDQSPAMSSDGKKRFLDAIAAGKGFVGSHCASDTFHLPGAKAFENQPQPDPYIQMLGGEFISHGPQQKSVQKVVSAKFPGAESLGPSFEMMEEWYSLKNFAPDLHVILVQETAGMNGRDYQRPPFPATWARRHGSGRVFYTSMGHREDVWTDERFQKLFLGGLGWSVGNIDAEITPNMKEVAPEAMTLPA